nr:hypothetical protein [Tanacetum cinerariifolium]
TMMTCHLPIRPAAICTVPRTQSLAASHVADSYGQSPVTWHLRQHRSAPVNDGQRRRLPVNIVGQRRCSAVNDGSRWRTALTAAGPPLTTTRPPVNGGWWAGQRSDLGRVYVGSGSGLGRVRVSHVCPRGIHVDAVVDNGTYMGVEPGTFSLDP